MYGIMKEIQYSSMIEFKGEDLYEAAYSDFYDNHLMRYIPYASAIIHGDKIHLSINTIKVAEELKSGSQLADYIRRIFDKGIEITKIDRIVRPNTDGGYASLAINYIISLKFI